MRDRQAKTAGEIRSTCRARTSTKTNNRLTANRETVTTHTRRDSKETTPISSYITRPYGQFLTRQRTQILVVTHCDNLSVFNQR